MENQFYSSNSPLNSAKKESGQGTSFSKKNLSVFTIILVFTLFFTFGTKNFSLAGPPSKHTALLLTGDGSISTSDDWLIVDSDIGNITSVEVFTVESQLVFNESGCYLDKCLYDISSLSNGYYLVVAYTANSSFSGSIMKK